MLTEVTLCSPRQPCDWGDFTTVTWVAPVLHRPGGEGAVGGLVAGELHEVRDVTALDVVREQGEVGADHA
ncbi:hypothetical protein, partial [Corynebacterium bovis]|uniref:hypothetical protein n=1 Tax=Corynebacterium bovis TaxID=36808 RepID=UPI00313928F8